MPEKPKKKNQNGGMALMMACCVLFSGAAGFGGGYLASQMHAEEPTAVISAQPGQTTAEYTPLSTTDSGMSIAQVAEKTADSVVEISTETVQMSSYWLQQYVTSGA
ncbi:MAG: serine protease HtrA, partial [Clostridia bacterium]|nr:serine protease HtrA [Clostridia bacterium]